MNKQFKVLLAMDTCETDRDLISAIPSFVGSQHFVIKGLYIKDADLLRAAGLPMVKEVSLTGVVRALSQESLSSQFNSAARRSQETLDAAGRDMGYSTSFEVVEGQHSSELARAATTMDFVIITRPMWPVVIRPRQGKHLQPLVGQAKSLLLVNEPWASGECVVAVYENEQSAQSVTVAARYAADTQLKSIVAAPVETELTESVNALCESTLNQLVRLEWNEENLARLCEGQDARLLVLAESDSTDWAKVLPKMIDRVPCSILRLA